MHTRLTTYQKLVNLPLSLIVKAICIPSDPVEQLELDPARPLLYVLPLQSQADVLTLRQICFESGLPDPLSELVIDGKSFSRVVFNAPTLAQLHIKNKTPNASNALFSELLELHKQNPLLDVQLVPVSVQWDRRPREQSEAYGAKLDSIHRLQKIQTILMLGRDCMVRFSPAVSMRYVADNYGVDGAIAHKLTRVASIHFSKQKKVASGPVLPERQALLNQLLASNAIDSAVQAEANNRGVSINKIRNEAREMAEEIAADFSPSVIRFGDRFLTWLWNRLYQGLTINNGEKVRALAQNGIEILYVPCHRSHMDYLLLSYVLYKEGLVPPHIAAGINLNFFPAGPIFRRGGAFFLRRTIKDNRLYSTVFREYLAELFSKGYSIEFFPEGGRSRTGRLIPPKTGMLAMTLQAMLRGLKRPVAIVPVYIGYEHVMEVNTYAKELQGMRKEKESARQVLGIVKKLRNYGKGYVNFGEPININHYLAERVPNWASFINPIEPPKPDWLPDIVNQLAHTTMTRINDAAATNALTLCATALLASRQNALSRETLQAQLDIYLQLQHNVPYSTTCSAPNESAADMLAHAISLNKFLVEKDALGEIISLDRQQAILMTYYRNNIIHLLVIPSLIAQLIAFRSEVTRQEIHASAQLLYPFLQAELYMGLSTAAVESYINAVMYELERQALIVIDGDTVRRNPARLSQLQLLGRVIAETLQRYAITLTLLNLMPNASKKQLEQQSQMLAQRLNRLHGINAPEFFDKEVFSTLFTTLNQQGYLIENSADAAIKITRLRNCLFELMPSDVQLTIDAIFISELAVDVQNNSASLTETK